MAEIPAKLEYLMWCRFVASFVMFLMFVCVGAVHGAKATAKMKLEK
jgi:hypothetical protein